MKSLLAKISVLLSFALVIASCTAETQSSDENIETSITGNEQREKTELNDSENLNVEEGVHNLPSLNNILQKKNGNYRATSYQAEYYPNFDTEEYDRIYDHEFLSVLENPLSTFSIDVDAASYSNMRRYINNGTLPPKDAVRIEELINYFNYDYPQPVNGDPFSITAEVSDCPWKTSNKLVLLGLQGKIIPTNKLPPSNLVFLIDVSGSMSDPNKLPLLKSAFKLLADQLRKEDRVAIVVYAGAAGLVLSSTAGNEKKAIIDALEKLEAGGSTAGSEGIRLAYNTAQKYFINSGNNRVILATDGDFNIGPSSDAELVRLIEEKRKQGIFLTVLGFGMGNYKDSKMEKLADKGNGNYAYVDNILEAKKVLVNEFGGTLFTIAKDVKIQVEFNPAKVKAYRLIGYENRLLNKEDFNDDRKDAGELGSGHSVTALYEIVLPGTEIDLPDVDSLKYQRTGLKDPAVHSDELLTVKFRYKPPSDTASKLIVRTLKDENFAQESVSINFKFAAAVAQFGMLLRDSKFKGSSSYNSTLDYAKGGIGKDKYGYRAEFIKLVEMCRLMERGENY